MRDPNRSSLTERDPGNVEAVIEKFEQNADPTPVKPRSGTQNVIDRFKALEGSLTVHSSVGSGTTVIGCPPVSAAESVT